MSAWLVDLWIEAVAWSLALALSPWGPWIALGLLVGAAILSGGAFFMVGRWSGRRRALDLGAEEVLTALERVVRGDHGGALDILQGSARSADAPAELYLAIASLLRARGHVERSAQVHLAVAQRPDLSDVLATRANIGLAADYLTLGRSADAEALLSKLPRKVRRQEALLALRRNAAMRAGDWKEALSASGLLSKRTGKSGEAVSEVHSHMAHSALERGDTDEAVSHFKRALRKDEDNLHAREGLARLYVADGKNFRARRLIVRGLKQCPDAAPRMLPLMRLALGRRDRYRSYLEELSTEGKGAPWVDLELAEMAYSDDDIDEALAILEDLVYLHPDSVDVREAYLNLLIAVADEHTIFAEVDRFVALAGAAVPRFKCDQCDYRDVSSFVKCARCGQTGTVRYLGS